MDDTTLHKKVNYNGIHFIFISSDIEIINHQQ